MSKATLALVLPSRIIYVAGHINGVVTVFNQDEETGKWLASVDASDDSLYRIALEMYDEAGNVGYYNEQIEYILPLFVYDRRQEDVDKVKHYRYIGWESLTDAQQEEWRKGMKGALNRSDLKRIENSIHVIAELFGVEVRTNKDNIPDIPTDVYFGMLLGNVGKLMELGYRYQGTPTLPEQPLTDYQKWNDIEHILHDMYAIYTESAASYDFAGEIYAGAMNLL